MNNKVPRREFLSAAGIFSLGLWFRPNSSLAETKTKRPNILFIMADDHTSQAWGCYGSRLAKHAPTKNIDRIRKEGAMLSNCFCTNSICVPSRASILTGQYGHLNGAKTLSGKLPPASDNVAKHLQPAGYETAIVGKWHLERKACRLRLLQSPARPGKVPRSDPVRVGKGLEKGWAGPERSLYRRDNGFGACLAG